MTDVRIYCRASTEDQDASRALVQLQTFAADKKLNIVSAPYIENASGAILNRPKLFKLIEEAASGDCILVEQIDRLTRLPADDWENLKAKMKAKKIRVVSLDLPTTWTFDKAADETQARVNDAINNMMMDLLATFAHKDYTDRRRRQAQGIEKAKAAGKYNGRAEDAETNAKIGKMLAAGMSWKFIMDTVGVARGTVAKVAKRQKAAAA